MNRVIKFLAMVAFIAVPLSVMAAGDDDLAVVVNKSNSATNLTKSQLRKLVLGEQDSWPSGQTVTVVLRNPGDTERDGVLRTICRMTEDDYNQHVVHARSSGEAGAAPKVIGSAAAVRQFVASTPGAIGFLRMADVNDTVKVVSVDGIAPGQAEYKVKIGNAGGSPGVAGRDVAPPPGKAQPVRVDGALQATKLVRRVNPVYPPLAAQARVQGVVVLEVLISNEGDIDSLRVVSGHPMLSSAAVDAVRQWKYRPTLLNGEAIQVITSVTLKFTL